MLDQLNNVFKPLRITIPFVLDIIFISDPDRIKQIENSGDIDRLHYYETQSLPWWIQLYFPSTRFHDRQRDLWFTPFESSSNPTYLPRLTYLEEQMATGYSQDDVRRIARLLRTKASDESLAYEMVQIVNKRFFESNIPLEITTAAQSTLQKITEAFLPWNYFQGVKSQQKIMDFCKHNLASDIHPLDVGHNIGEIVKLTTGSLKILRENLNRSVEDIFTKHAPTTEVPRIAIKASTFNGMLSYPTIAGQTILVLNIAKAAAETKDLRFTFGTGTSERSCVFKEFFVNFMKDVQYELQREQVNS